MGEWENEGGRKVCVGRLQQARNGNETFLSPPFATRPPCPPFNFPLRLPLKRREREAFCFVSSAYLTRRVDDFSCELLPAMFDHLAERILDGGVIALDEMSLNELNRERRFSYPKKPPPLALITICEIGEKGVKVNMPGEKKTQKKNGG